MLSIDATAIVSFLIVWILVFFLNKLFFRPVQRIMKERESKIQENKDASKKILKSYEESMQEIEKTLSAARVMSEQKKEEFISEALKEKNRLLTEINTEYRNQVEKAKAELNAQMQNLKKELDSEAVVLAGKIEERLLN